MGQVPAESYTKRTQAKSHNSERLQSDRHENTYQWRNHLYHSHPSAVKLRTRICFTGGTYLSSGTCFDSL